MKKDNEKKASQKKTVKADELIKKYSDQTETEDDIHFEHYDWTYNDSSCCC